MLKDEAISKIVAALKKELKEKPKPNPAESLLWLADEHEISNADLSGLKNANLRFISNRFDQCKLAKKAGLDAEFSDFALCSNSSKKEASPSQIFFRVSKERAQIHHIINNAYLVLPVGGRLWLSGYKNEGIKTHIERAATLFGTRANVSKGKNQLSVACIEKVMKKASEAEGKIDDQNYSQLRTLQFSDGLQYWTKPGIYGWDKLDKGSQFLVEALAKHTRDLTGLTLLDLGCGYGYLSLSASKLNPKHLVATDNSAGAIQAATKNLGNQESTEVIASDAGENISGKFDLILCNPPFHQGFSTSDQLHRKFLANTKRLLTVRGQAWYVVNQFLPLQKHCAEIGLNCTEVSRNDSFKVFQISK